MLCVAILLMPQVVYGFSYENPKMAERIQWLNGDIFEGDMEVLRQQKPRYIEVVMEVSAYTSAEGGNTGAWGKELAVGDVASDDLPQGTVVVIEGREYMVNDVFGGGYVGKLDIYMDDYDAAVNFGRRTMKVTVLQRIPATL